MYETLRERPREGEGGNSPIKQERNSRNTEGGKKHQTMVAQSTPKMPKWHHSALKAWWILARILGSRVDRRELMAFQVAIPTSFQGSLPGASPLTISLARSASDCASGSMIPRPPLDKGSVRESHSTSTSAWEAFPPQMKFRTTPQIWLHILGWGFQQAGRKKDRIFFDVVTRFGRLLFIQFCDAATLATII